MTKFAATHPGKLGDMLYILPTIRYIYKATGIKFDVWTSEYCAPLKELFEYQQCVDKFYVSPDYKLERMDMGCQPWYVPVPIQQYARTYQLGFRSVPDCMLHQFIGRYAGIEVPLAIEYDVPEYDVYNQKYITIAPRGLSSFNAVFERLVDLCMDNGYDVLVVGGSGDNQLNNAHKVYDMTGLDFLETASIISKAKAFVGLMSSQLVLANGFDIPRIALNGYMADMRHSIITAQNYYPGPNTSADDIIALFDK